MPELQQSMPSHGYEESLLDKARSISGLIKSRAAEAEAQSRLTDDVVAAIREEGLYALLVPDCLGGHEADLTVALKVCQEIARADGSAGWCFMAQMCWNSAAGAYMGDSAVEDIFANGPDAVIAGQGMPNGTAEIVEGGHIVNGHWRYGSGIAHAELVQCGCILTKNGKPIQKPNGAPKLRLCATKPENVKIIENWDVMGLRATGSHDYRVENLFVPDEFSYDTDETSRKRGGGVYSLGLKNTTALGHTAFALGVARRALEELRELVLEKRASAYGCIGHVPAFQKDYAMAELQIRSLETLAEDRWGAVQEAISAGVEPDMTTIALVRGLTRHAHEVASDVISFAYKMAGGAALHPSDMQRCFRDIHAGTQHVLVSHQIASAAGKVILGLNEPEEHWEMLGLES